jgi:hypothetical protein
MVARAEGEGDDDVEGAGDRDVDEAGSVADAVDEGLDEVGDDDVLPQPIRAVQTNAASRWVVRGPPTLS